VKERTQREKIKEELSQGMDKEEGKGKEGKE